MPKNTKQELLNSLKTCTAIANNINNKNYMQGGEIQTLKEFIKANHNGSQSSFAIANKIHKQQVSLQLRAEFIVIDNVLYRKSRAVV